MTDDVIIAVYYMTIYGGLFKTSSLTPQYC